MIERCWPHAVRRKLRHDALLVSAPLVFSTRPNTGSAAVESDPSAAAPKLRRSTLGTAILSHATIAILGACSAFVASADEAVRGPHDFVQYSIGGLLIVQTGLIAALLIQDRRRRRAKQDTDKLHTEMTHAARLAIAGEMTASIAHEITQPLSAILSNVETAELLLNEPGANAAAIADILADIKRDDLRANEIVRRLRTLLRKRELHFERMDINVLVSNALALIRADASRRNIMIRLDLEPDLPYIAADPVHLQQVLLNLLLNAMDAMKNTPPTARWLDIRTRLLPRSAIEVSIDDTGHGMTPEQLAKAFDSFFTTKEGGMGLGLSIARSIVQAHSGTIWAESREGGGTAFHFTVPLQQTRRWREPLRAVAEA